MSKPYYEKLKDPRWQKKRLEVFERDEFSCCRCEGDEDTLHVHHGHYDKRDPWEHENETLWTVCKDCHIIIQNQLNFIKHEIGEICPVDYQEVAAIVSNLKLLNPNDYCKLYDFIKLLAEGRA